jgi:hypothetical protein
MATLFDLYTEIQNTIKNISNAELRCRLNMDRQDCTKDLKRLKRHRDKLIKSFEHYLKNIELNEKQVIVIEKAGEA